MNLYLLFSQIIFALFRVCSANPGPHSLQRSPELFPLILFTLYKALKDIDSANVEKLTYQKIAHIKWGLANETLRILF